MKIWVLLLGALLSSEFQVYSKAVILQTNKMKLVVKKGSEGGTEIEPELWGEEGGENTDIYSL